MKKNEQAETALHDDFLEKVENSRTDQMFFIPPGAKFSDIYMDAQEVARELKICKRVVTNMRKAGELSYTSFYEKGKIYYLRQEIAAILEANIVVAKNSILKKKGREFRK